MGDNRRTFRFSDEDNGKLAAIAEHYFGAAKGNDTAALKLLINKEYKDLKIKKK